jgi:glutamate decarboxylase
MCSLFHNDSTGDDNFEVNDLADLTPQCGRKGDAFKLFLSWAYYGNDGLAAKIGNAFDRADQLMSILEKDQDFVLVSKRPLPCLQVRRAHRLPGGDCADVTRSASTTPPEARWLAPKRPAGVQRPWRRL